MTIEPQDRGQKQPYRILYLLFFTFLLLIGWLVWTKTESIQAPAGAEGDRESRASLLAAAALPADPAAASGIRRQSLSPPSPREIDACQSYLQVKVVLAESGKPAAKATVVLRPDGRLGWADRERLAATVSDRRLQAQVLPGHDQCFSADENGEARIPLPPVPAFLFAISADKEKASLPVDARVDPDKPERFFVLNLRPCRGLVVRVVDGQGRPRAGVPVGILLPAADPAADRPPEIVFMRMSGPAGEAVFPEAERLRHGTTARVAAGFAFPLPKPRRDLVPLAGLPAGGCIELALPPTGSVAADVLDEQGAPLLTGASAVVVLETGKAPPLGIRWFWRPRSREWFLRSAIRAEGGRVRFPHVGLGLNLEVLAFGDGRPGMAVGSCLGPQAEGQEVVVRLRFPGVPPVLVGRAVTEENTALANVGLEVMLPELPSSDLRFCPMASIGCDLVRTGGNGAFRLHLPAECGPGGARQILLAAVPEREGGPVLQAVLDLSAAVAAERNFGDVVFFAPRPLVAGIVVDQDGRPVPRATVHFDAREPGAAPGRWERIAVKEADDAGRFSCSSAMPWEMVKVTVGKRGLVQGGPEEAPAGSRDLRIVLQGAGQIQGRVLVAEALLAEPQPLIICALSRVGDDAERVRICTLSPQGGFGWGGLTPGVYRLGVRLNGTTEDFFTVDNIQVEAGKASADPRLEGLDLRERVKPVVLTVLDLRGKPVNAEVKGRVSVPIGPGRIRLAVETGNPPTLTLAAPGHKDAVVERLAKDRRVVMEEAE